MIDAHSSFWALTGLGLWILVLSIPLLIYFLIASLQRGRSKSEPRIELGERLDTDKPEQKDREAS